MCGAFDLCATTCKRCVYVWCDAVDLRATACKRCVCVCVCGAVDLSATVCKRCVWCGVIDLCVRGEASVVGWAACTWGGRAGLGGGVVFEKRGAWSVHVGGGGAPPDPCFDTPL